MIDACRPGHSDIDEPEFKELVDELSQNPELRDIFTRSQEVDAAIRTTFQTVTLPPGLENRLLMLVEALEQDGDVAKFEPQTAPVEVSNRRSFAIVAAFAVMGTVAAAITWLIVLPKPASMLSDQAIAEQVDQWNTKLDEAGWQSVANGPTQDFPEWQHLKLRAEDRWQWISRQQVVCYDFAISQRSNREIVRLFVRKATSSDRFPASPSAGYPSPHGWHIGAWRANNRVYYLAVKAERDSRLLYSRIVKTQISPA